MRHFSPTVLASVLTVSASFVAASTASASIIFFDDAAAYNETMDAYSLSAYTQTFESYTGAAPFSAAELATTLGPHLLQTAYLDKLASFVRCLQATRSPLTLLQTMSTQLVAYSTMSMKLALSKAA